MRIEQLRRQRRITQTQLAEACGTSQQQIAKIESGLVDPRLSTLRKLARALRCELEELFFTRAEFLKQVRSVVAERGLNPRKLTLLELNRLCADTGRIPAFHPLWEEIELKGGEARFKEGSK